MDKIFNMDFELRGTEKEKWERHLFLLKLYEEVEDIEDIAKIAGLSKEEMDKLFPRLY